MKALRRSIKGEKEKQNINIAPKAAVAIVPPKKVIRALYDYEAQSTQELSFSRGDFFHVIGRENDPDWYEACNPALPDARGLVPVAFFQALGKTERDSQQSDGGRAPTSNKSADHDSGYGEASSVQSATAAQSQARTSQRTSKSVGAKAGTKVYGRVLYDFAAERADELEAKKGESIIVIAQSNPEWFVAKPISRLGGPGLIPVSFVELLNMDTGQPLANPEQAIEEAGIPKVEEWKKMAAEYKNSSITLGKFEGGSGSADQMEQGMQRMSLQQGRRQTSQSGQQSMGPGSSSRVTSQQQHYQQQQASFSQPTLNNPRLLSPERVVIRDFKFHEDKFWFIVAAELSDRADRATMSDPNPPLDNTSVVQQYYLLRYYEDFYDLQVSLITEFPTLAGNGATQRTLPFMPGPVSYVTKAITRGRLDGLNDWVKNLLRHPAIAQEPDRELHPSKLHWHRLVQEFFAPREGDSAAGTISWEEEERLAFENGARGGELEAQNSGAQYGNSFGGLNPSSGLTATHPGLDRQASSLSQPSQTSLSGTQGGGNGPAPTIKVKVHYNGEIIALLVANDIEYEELRDRIRDRFKVASPANMKITFKDEQSGRMYEMRDNNDLDHVIESMSGKPVLYIET